MTRTTWQTKDAWVLSVLPKFRGGDLSHVIGDFDALNHDIIPREDLEAALQRLGGAGLARLGERIALTRRGRSVVRKGHGGGMIERALSLQSVLETIPPATDLPNWQIEQQEYDAAYARYVKRMSSLTR